MRKKKKSLGKIILFTTFVFLLSMLMFGNKTWRQLMSMYKDVKILEKEINKVKAKSSKLEEEIFQLKTNFEYIEKIAREELGLIRSGEIEYRFINLKNKQIKNREKQKTWF